MQLRRKTFQEIISDKDSVKALALLFFVKSRRRSSVITSFSYNKLRKITGLHITTLRKYIQKLKELKLVEFIGKHKQSLLFKGDYSKDKRKNVNLDSLIYDSVKDIANSLYAMFVVEEQRRKDFVKHVILISTGDAPKEVSPQECIAASKLRNRNGYGNVYHETGISYKGLAQRLKVFTQKTVSIIKYACKHGFITKQSRLLWEQCDDAFIRAKLGIDYVYAKVMTKINNVGETISAVFGLRVKANAYAIGQRAVSCVAPLSIPMV